MKTTHLSDRIPDLNKIRGFTWWTRFYHRDSVQWVLNRLLVDGRRMSVCVSTNPDEPRVVTAQRLRAARRALRRS